jgi:hypothetical protein
MGLSIEAVLDKVRTVLPRSRLPVTRKVEPLHPPSPAVKKGSDTSKETMRIRESVNRRAHTIAHNVRQTGEQKYGLMWAQGYAVLPDGRTAFLQQQQDKLGRNETLGISIPCSPGVQQSIDIRYDLRYRHDFINSFEVRQENGTPVTSYCVHDCPDGGRRIPTGLMLYEIVGPVDEILQIVEGASENIVWKKPGSVPELSPVRTSGVLQAGEQVIILQ